MNGRIHSSDTTGAIGRNGEAERKFGKLIAYMLL